MFVNAESASGYVLRYCVYTGSADAAEDATQCVVMSLMEKYLDKNHKLLLIFLIPVYFYVVSYMKGEHSYVVQCNKEGSTILKKMKVWKNSNKNNLVCPQYKFAMCGDYTVRLWG